MTTAVQPGGGGFDRPSASGLADVIDTILDKGLVLDAYVRVSLVGIEPTIWRRIQVRDGTLDKLHEHIQTAMGWTNSHLHHFVIGTRLYGDPLLLQVVRDSFVRGQHEFFNEAMREVALGACDGLHQTEFIELDHWLGEVEVDGSAALALTVQDLRQIAHQLEN